MARHALAYAASGLLITYLVVPDDFSARLAVVAFGIPQGVAFALGPGHITLIDLLMIICSAVGIAIRRRIVVDPFLWLFVAELFSLVVFWGRLTSGNQPFLDGVAKMVSGLSVYLLMLNLLSREQLRRALVTSLDVLLVGCLLAAALWHGNPEAPKRFNTAGMGPGESAYVFGAAALFHLSSILRGRWSAGKLFARCFPFFLGMLLTVCRSAVLWMIILVPWVLKVRGVRLGRFIPILVLSAGATGLLLGYSWWGAAISERYGSATDLEASLQGRLDALLASVKLLSDYPFGVGYSDWYIEYGLRQVGYPSHSHNVLLQVCLQLGPFTVLLIPLARYLITVIRAKSDASFAVVILLLYGLISYPFYNPKIVALLIAMSRLSSQTQRF